MTAAHSATCPTEVEYDGEDLEVLLGLHRYRQWIFSDMAPYLGSRSVEIGAGIGSFTKLLLGAVDTLDVIEPSPPLHPWLERQFGGLEQVRIVPDSAERWIAGARPGAYDSVVLINVLEHMQDDDAMLRNFAGVLAPGGYLLLFVPALMLLFSELDRRYGHYRRYALPALRRQVAAAGFSIVTARYFDILGLLPWLILNTWMGKTAFSPRLTRLYDRFGVPLTRAVESMVTPPVGKNILLIARKSMD